MADVAVNLDTENHEELLGQGVRCFAIRDYSNAVAAFGKATELMAKEHGDLHDSLGEVYVQYGRALLELYREESGPFGEGVPRGDSDSDSEEAEVENGENEGAEEKEGGGGDKKEDTAVEGEENGDADKKGNGKVEEEKNGGDTEEVKKDDDKKETDEVTEKNGESIVEDSQKTETEDKETVNGEAGESSKLTEETDDIEELSSDLQLAWELIELAKNIFTKRGDAGKKQLADAHLLLGDVGLESGNYLVAIDDIKASIELQNDVYESTSRIIAESHYKLGTAYSYASPMIEAVNNFEKSVDVLKKRLELLENESNKNKTELQIKDRKDEIEEIKELIPEVEEKITEAKNTKIELVSS